jgi:aryl-alcohol dehydrogenase-like predicted oxidoreductase
MSDLPISVLGRTGVPVTKLAYGAMELREPRAREDRRQITPEEAGAVLNAVLDHGISLIDTSPDYGRSEELIGRFIAHRRSEFFLASKCGCPIDPPPGERPPHSFTRKNVRAGVEQSLKRLKTDHLDLVQFHMSPSRSELEENDSVAELQALQQEGKVRFVGISGILPNLADHIAMGVFDAFQIPYSALEREHEAAIHEAAASGARTIIRGGVARGITVATGHKLAGAAERLARRRDLWEAAQLDEVLDGISRMEFILRFTLSHPVMTTTIVGTANIDHLNANVAAARKGALPTDQYEEAKRRLSIAAKARDVVAS